MILAENIKKAIAEHAKELQPFECVGLILERSGSIETKRLKNISAQAKYHCFVGLDQINAAAEGSKILAVYHSHFESEDFSLEDKATSEKYNFKMVLYCVDKKIFKIYSPNGFIAPYVGRPWRQGIFTCIELLEDYCKNELKIEIKGWENVFFDNVEPEDLKCFPTSKVKYFDLGVFYSKTNTDPIYKKYSNLFSSNKIYFNFLLDNGFKPVKDLKKHDLLLTSVPFLEETDCAMHGAVFLGDGKILHHPYRRESAVAKFDEAFKFSLKHILRHESLL